MEILRKYVYGISRAVDFMAGFILMSVAGLVVANILMRTLFNDPIQGTYELVGYLTASAIGLSLANCAVQNSHIAVGFFSERFPVLLRKITAFLVNGLSFIFLLLVSWHLGRYAIIIAESGRVSNTLQIPFYPFIYIVCFGFLVLALVAFIRFLELFSAGGDSK